MGPKFKKSPNLLWTNAMKALLTDLWFERNQRVFHDKETLWFSCLESARLNVSSWCSLSKIFTDYPSKILALIGKLSCQVIIRPLPPTHLFYLLRAVLFYLPINFQILHILFWPLYLGCWIILLLRSVSTISICIPFVLLWF